MTLLAILLDVIALASYYVQLNTGGTTIYLLGLFLQAILTVGLLWLTITYGGQRYANPWLFGRHVATVRFTIISVSFILNAIMTFMYTINYFDINRLIFNH